MSDDLTDLAALYEIAARMMGGTLVRVEGEGVIAYHCGKCGNEHYAKVELQVTPFPNQNLEALLPAIDRPVPESDEARSTVIPEAFRKAFE
jgi:hypothetical protein